jgi:hypothetical protein
VLVVAVQVLVSLQSMVFVPGELRLLCMLIAAWKYMRIACDRRKRAIPSSVLSHNACIIACSVRCLRPLNVHIAALHCPVPSCPADPFYNEPGYESYAKTARGQQQAADYNRDLRTQTAR